MVINYSKSSARVKRSVILLLLAGLASLLIIGLIIFPTGSNDSDSNETDDLLQVNIEGKSATLFVEIADTDPERTTGLMNRESLPDNRGMLFVFDREEFRSFWMKNTYISLDIIFINKDKEVINIHQSTEPLNTEKSYYSDQPVQFVLEVNGGWSILNNLKRGDVLIFDIKN